MPELSRDHPRYPPSVVAEEKWQETPKTYQSASKTGFSRRPFSEALVIAPTTLKAF
jgi:hypothetical protein